jgi:hypothetical protein
MTSEDQIVDSMTTNVDENENNQSLDFDFDAVVHVKDATADASVAPRPPKAGIWAAKIKRNMDKKAVINDREFIGVLPAKDKSGIPYVAAHLTCLLIDDSDNEDDNYNGYQLNAFVSSQVGKGRPTSTLHSLLNYLGAPLSNNESLGSIITKATETFDEEPVGYVKVEWKAQYQDNDGRWKFVALDDNGNFVSEGTQGAKNLDRMENFPFNNETQEYDYIVESPKDGTPIYASAYIPMRNGFVKGK